MEPTYSNGNTIIFQKQDNLYKDEIIIAKEPENWKNYTQQSSDKIIIKRLVGLPNDIITYNNNSIYINDKKYTMPDDINCTIPDNFSIIIPENKYVVFGDNTNTSIDSRRLLCLGDTNDFFVDKIDIINHGKTLGKF